MTERHQEQRDLALNDLRFLLAFPRLGEWGMETLNDTLVTLLPGLSQKRDIPTTSE